MQVCEHVVSLDTSVEPSGCGMYADCSATGNENATLDWLCIFSASYDKHIICLQCGGTRCPNPLPMSGWLSNIAVQPRRATSARLSWTPDLNLVSGARYRVVWREFNTDDNFDVQAGPKVRKLTIIIIVVGLLMVHA